ASRAPSRAIERRSALGCRSDARVAQQRGRVTKDVPRSLHTSRFATGILLALALSGAAHAEEPARLADDQWKVTSSGRLAVDAGLLLGRPMTLDSGMATGAGAGVTYGRRFAFGARVSWSTAPESSLAWTVTHDQYRLRAIAVVQQPVGRGALALRLGVGPTFVYEDRTRNQGARAGLTGSDLENTALVA